MNCQFLKPNGIPCGAFAVGKGTYCYFHDPDVPEIEKTAARARGGLSTGSTGKEPLPAIDLSTARDAMNLFCRTINELRAGLIDVRVANCIGFLTGQFIRAVELTEVEEKLAKIEEMLNQPTPPR